MGICQKPLKHLHGKCTKTCLYVCKLEIANTYVQSTGTRNAQLISMHPFLEVIFVMSGDKGNFLNQLDAMNNS